MGTKRHKFTRYEQNFLKENGLKGCSECGRVEVLSRFRLNADGIYNGHCKYCRHLKYTKKSKKLSYEDFYHKLENSNRQERLYITKLKRQYGISFKEAKKIHDKKQCSICKKIVNSKKRLCVDHCHSSNEIRGFLCSNCNAGLGMFKDNILNLKNAIKYLKNFLEGH